MDADAKIALVLELVSLLEEAIRAVRAGLAGGVTAEEIHARIQPLRDSIAAHNAAVDARLRALRGS